MTEAREVSLATRPAVTESTIFIILVVTICLNSLGSAFVEVFTISELFLEVIYYSLY